MEQIFYRAGYKYQLAEDYSVIVPVVPERDISLRFIKLTLEGRLTIREDYAWDGPSGPTQDTPDSLRASLVHDALYALMREGQLDAARWRDVADREFYRVLIEDGMETGRARAWYRGVCIFAEPSARPESAKPVMMAPLPVSSVAPGPWPVQSP